MTPSVGTGDTGQRGGDGLRDPARTYRERADRAADSAARTTERSRRLSWFRVGLFLGLVILLFWSEWNPPPFQSILRIGLLLGLVAFLALVVHHRRIRRRITWFETLFRLNREGLRRMGREWDVLPQPPGLDPPADHPYGRDLGISGPASLARLLGTVASAPGRDTLRDWLLSPPPSREVSLRQDAVRGLVPLLDMREELTATGRVVGALEASRYEELSDWARSPAWLLPRKLRVWAIHVLPLLTLPLVYLTLQEWLSMMDLGSPAPWFPPFPLTLGLVVTQALLALSMRKPLEGLFERASTEAPAVRDYGFLFRVVEKAPLPRGVLRDWQEELEKGALPAHQAFLRLRRLLEWADARHSGFHELLDSLLFWDAHVALGLERWKRQHGDEVARWFRALGRVDAAAGLAAVAWDHPDWSFPDVTSGEETTLTAQDLGHPLLHPARCVRNDVEVGPAGTFLLVTGSNMSGKSTLLRAVGLNVVLGRAGGPVCASHLRLPYMQVHTTMGVSDSLAEGLSQFSAELRRLKQIQDRVQEADARGQGPTLCLLDELLRGTNTLERRAGARRILRSLLRHQTLIMVTSHDLELADVPDLARRSVPVHFDGTVQEDPEGGLHLSFDYRLRKGLATTTNALALMDVMGLGIDEDSGTHLD
jgi:hypothetical protein